VRHLLEFVERSRQGGWEIASTDGKLDTTSAAGKFQVTVLAAAAELERDLAVERTTEGMAAKREQGVRLGRPSAVPMVVRERIVRDRRSGLSFAAIADALNKEQVATVRGGARWYPSSVRAVAMVAEHDAYAEQRRSQRTLVGQR
jgi:DNA invertase Pin-like site-specific DNA recombinase